ncbi:hypothetical protein FRD01_14595 [Microvenator marinus]|uniref:LPP20 lipoprotein n=1 Tax=Microvenator marinus TaxID=2600177 RepID=A0A5B8XT52_9DELT|nr:hypothetical protein [Microvenator marinus]QED28441.1 hypothetical protein FRD01_14595 [Microvenator marinus]
MRQNYGVVFFSLTVLLSAACGGPETRQEKLEQTSSSSWGEVPEWADKVPAGCGVGSAKFRGNRSMTRDSAVSRARADLGRQLETRVQDMFKDYRAEGEAAGEDFSEERVTSVTRNITDVSLAGTSVEANFLTDTDPQEFYALVCINTAKFIEAFGETEGLSDSARAALKARAESEFKDLDEQLKKLDGKSSDE